MERGAAVRPASGTMDVFRNPPGFAALFAPLSQLPIRPVALAWRALGIGLLLLGLRRFLAAAHPIPLPPRAAATVWITAAFLALPAFNNGQVNTLIAVAALHGIASAIRGGWWAASGWLMLAAWLKGYKVALAGRAGGSRGVARPGPARLADARSVDRPAGVAIRHPKFRVRTRTILRVLARRPGR